eukprot:5911744-Prymnesium_polylepis.1
MYKSSGSRGRWSGCSIRGRQLAQAQLPVRRETRASCAGSGAARVPPLRRAVCFPVCSCTRRILLWDE